MAAAGNGYLRVSRWQEGADLYDLWEKASVDWGIDNYAAIMKDRARAEK